VGCAGVLDSTVQYSRIRTVAEEVNDNNKRKQTRTTTTTTATTHSVSLHAGESRGSGESTSTLQRHRKAQMFPDVHQGIHNNMIWPVCEAAW